MKAKWTEDSLWIKHCHHHHIVVTEVHARALVTSMTRWRPGWQKIAWNKGSQRTRSSTKKHSRQNDDKNWRSLQHPFWASRDPEVREGYPSCWWSSSWLNRSIDGLSKKKRSKKKGNGSVFIPDNDLTRQEEIRCLLLSETAKPSSMRVSKEKRNQVQTEEVSLIWAVVFHSESFLPFLAGSAGFFVDSSSLSCEKKMKHQNQRRRRIESKESEESEGRDLSTALSTFLLHLKKKSQTVLSFRYLSVTLLWSPDFLLLSFIVIKKYRQSKCSLQWMRKRKSKQRDQWEEEIRTRNMISEEEGDSSLPASSSMISDRDPSWYQIEFLILVLLPFCSKGSSERSFLFLSLHKKIAIRHFVSFLDRNGFSCKSLFEVFFSYESDWQREKDRETSIESKECHSGNKNIEIFHVVLQRERNSAAELLMPLRYLFFESPFSEIASLSWFLWFFVLEIKQSCLLYLTGEKKESKPFYDEMLWHIRQLWQ